MTGTGHQLCGGRGEQVVQVHIHVMGAGVLVGGGSMGQLVQGGHEACEGWKGYTYIVRCKTIDSTADAVADYYAHIV